MAEGITFISPTVEVTDEDQEKALAHEQNSQMLADALARMDGLIGDYRYLLSSQPASHCTTTATVLSS